MLCRYYHHNEPLILAKKTKGGKTAVELLSCAGSEESLRAAVNAGADAVYFGTTLFNARMNAKNFTREQTERAIGFCHERGVRCYVTMNTLITDRMMPEALGQAEFLYRSGADALIVADLGLAGLIHTYLPDFELHASTQCSGHNSEAARFLKSLGFSRMVAARELSEKELFALAENSPIETEMFIHGALCVCQSGQCLLSSFIGGRSGNRGECAQPCRMTYNSGYPLSLKDLCLAGHMREILASKVTSLKIEGRMKSPSYTGAVTAVYRRLIDERRNAEPSEIKALADVFSRSGFTDGYFTSRTDKSMLGVRSRQDIEATRRYSASFASDLRSLSRDTRDEHTDVADNSVDCQEKGRQEAQNEWQSGQKSDQGAAGCPKKTPVTQGQRKFTIPEDALRQIQNKTEQVGFPPKDSAFFFDPRAIPELGEYGIRIVYVPLDKLETAGPAFGASAEKGVALPPVIPESELPGVEARLKRAASAGVKHVLVTNIGGIGIAKRSGLVPHGDWRLNITSKYTAAVYSGILYDMTLSVELTLPQIRDINVQKNVVVYGKQPLMVLEKPVGTGILKDRTGACFEITRQAGRDILLNSVPTYMADKQAELKKCGKFGRHYIFTTEKPSSVLDVLKAYKQGRPSKKPVRRIK